MASLDALSHLLCYLVGVRLKIASATVSFGTQLVSMKASNIDTTMESSLAYAFVTYTLT